MGAPHAGQAEWGWREVTFTPGRDFQGREGGAGCSGQEPRQTLLPSAPRRGNSSACRRRAFPDAGMTALFIDFN